MQPWKTNVICAGKYRPRQFEYHPLHKDVVVFGTLRGEFVFARFSGASFATVSPLSRPGNDYT